VERVPIYKKWGVMYPAHPETGPSCRITSFTSSEFLFYVITFTVGNSFALTYLFTNLFRLSHFTLTHLRTGYANFDRWFSGCIWFRVVASVADNRFWLHANCALVFCHPGADPGGPAPLFWQSQFYFLKLYTMSEKLFLKLNLDIIVAEIRGVFGSVGDVCVCVNRNRGRYCFLLSKGPILNDIRGHSDPKNICQIAGNRI